MSAIVIRSLLLLLPSLSYLFLAIIPSSVNLQLTSQNPNIVEWHKLKKLLLSTETNQTNLNVITLIYNERLAKQNQNMAQYLNYAKQEFFYAQNIFNVIISQNDVVPEDSLYMFGQVKYNKDILDYIQDKLNTKDAHELNKWTDQHVAFVLMLTNRGRVVLMHNVDQLNHFLILQWVEKQSRLSLIREAKQLSSFGDLTVNLMNIILVFTCLASFVAGVRKDIFFVRQFSVVPAVLFTSGHIWNQLRGPDSDNSVTTFGISISPSPQGQNISESLFIFVLYLVFSVSMFNYSLDKPIRSNNHLTAVDALTINPKKAVLKRQQKGGRKGTKHSTVNLPASDSTKLLQVFLCTVSFLTLLAVFRVKMQ